jgi:drug/metabolite transporter (DMT)-like permease
MVVNSSKGLCYIVVAVLALFITGSANTILTKVLLTTQAVGEDGKMETFQKPFFGTFNMFFAMALVMIVHWASKATSRNQHMIDLDKKLLPDEKREQEEPQQASTTKKLLLTAPPAFLDLVAMILMLIGMLFLPASIWQMLRGANIIFAAILTIVILRRKLRAYHWVGVSLALVGILIVSAAALSAGGSDSGDSDSSKSGNDVAIGVGIVIFAQVIQATQIILEEELLNDLGMEPMLVVGVEGLWGLLFMCVIMPILMFLPGSDNGHVEDSVDTYRFLMNSSSAQAVVVAYMVSVATYNVSGMMVTQSLTGVMRVMLEATRTLTIWIFNLFWHYSVDSKSKFGEEWTNWSYLQAAGFLVLIIGQATYGRKIEWPCLSYDEPEPPAEELFASPGAVRAGAFASPASPVVRQGAFASPRSPGAHFPSGAGLEDEVDILDLK